MPSDAGNRTKPSSSRCAGATIIRGYRMPAVDLWRQGGGAGDVAGDDRIG